MPAVRSRTMGIKVTDEEYEQMEAEATARGQTMSDWGREVLLNQRRYQHHRRAYPYHYLYLGQRPQSAVRVYAPGREQHGCYVIHVQQFR